MAELMVLEDDPGTRRALHSVARQLGHNVQSFSEPVSAMDAMEQKLPDVLVTDWDLDSCFSGVYVAMHALSKRPTAQIILITGNDMDQLKRQTSAMPNVFYIAKPFDLRTVRGAITAACASTE